jgi:hypothetical protein
MPVDDLFGAIKSIPGAVKAIAELVGEIGHVGTSVAKIGKTKADQRRINCASTGRKF